MTIRSANPLVNGANTPWVTPGTFQASHAPHRWLGDACIALQSRCNMAWSRRTPNQAEAALATPALPAQMIEAVLPNGIRLTGELRDWGNGIELSCSGVIHL